MALAPGPSQFEAVEQLLTCPVCATDHVSLSDAVAVVAGKDDYQARRNVRGNVLCLPGRCEDGHRFTLCFGQHKGRTYTWAERREDAI